MMEMVAEMVRMLLQPELYHCLMGAWPAFAESAAATLLTAIWQGLAIALLLSLSMRFAPRVSAGARFVLLACGFVAIVMLPFLPMLHVAAGRRAAMAPEAVAAGAPAHAWLILDSRWSVALTLLWLGASVWRAFDLGVHTLRLRRLWKSARPVEHSLEMPKLRGRRAIEICTTEELERPSVIGFAAPRILIPSWLLERMTQAELEQIVLHETEHLRRLDDWTNLLQKISLVVFPLNPALVWMERRLCQEREMACDEGVVRRTRAPRAYAACLTQLAEHALEKREQALSLGAWRRRPELARRVHSLLARKPVLKPALAGSMVAVMGCGIVAGSAELARCPQMIGFAVTPAVAEGHRKDRGAALAAMEGDRVLRPELRPELGNAGLVDSGIRETAENDGRALPVTRLRATAPVRMRAGGSAAQEELVRGAQQDEFPALSARAESPVETKTLQGGAAQPKAEVLQAKDSAAQGWVVMTMWEQSETTAPVVSDSAETADRDTAASQARSAMGPAQVTVTRLVYRVAAPYAAATDGKNGQEAATSNASGGKSSAGGDDKADKRAATPQMPVFMPVRGGWLIFQL